MKNKTYDNLRTLEATSEAAASGRDGRLPGRRPSDWLKLFTSTGMVLAILVLPWFRFGEQSYTAGRFILSVYRAGGAEGFLSAYEEVTGWAYRLSPADLTLVYGAAWIVPVLGVLGYTRILLIAAKKRTVLPTALLYGGSMVYLCLFGLFTNPDAGPGILVFYAFVLIDLVLGKYLDERKELLRMAEESRERRRSEREEKRRREFFAGQYDREFFRLVFKNFLYNRRSYVLFLAAGAGMVALFFVLFGILTAYRASGVRAERYYTGKLQAIASGVLPVLAFSGMLLLALIITHYIRTRMRNYSVYQALGTRKRTMARIIAFEFLTCVLLALIGGSLIGGVICKHFGTPVLLPLLFTAGLYALIVLIATLVNYHRFEYRNIFRLGAEVDAEGRPHSVFVAGILPGLLMILFALFNRNRLGAAESFSSTLYLFGGMFLLLFGLLGLRTERRAARAANRGEALLAILPWRYRFRSNFRMLYLLFILHFLALGIYLPELAAVEQSEEANLLFPYDFVCPTYPEDDAVFREIQETGAAVQEVRMLRATTPLGTPLAFGDYFSNPSFRVLWPQGRHIVLAESDYRLLCRENNIAAGALPPDEEGHGFRILLQQDLSVRGHPLEYLTGTGYQLRIGQPIPGYDPMMRDRIFKPRTVAVERTVLLGMLRNGEMENVLVIDDDWFDLLYSGWWDEEANAEVSAPVPPSEIREGPSVLRLVKCSTDEEPRIREKLLALDDVHREDLRFDTIIHTVYAKSDLMEQVQNDRRSAKFAYLLTTAVALFSAIFLFHIKFGLEGDEADARFRLLSQLGMRLRDQRRLLLREILPILGSALLLALGLSLPWIRAMVRLRMMSGAEIAGFLGALLPLFSLYIGVYVLVTAIQIGRFIHVHCH